MVNFRLFTLIFLQFIVSRCIVNGIINGNNALPNEFPALASIFAQNCTVLKPCTGFFISKDLLVTAAGCVADFQHIYVFPVRNNFYNFSGEVSSFNHTGKFMQSAVNVLEIHVHPQFNPNTSAYNIAVLKVDCDIPQSKYTKYASICKCGKPRDNELLTIAGFGSNVAQQIGGEVAVDFPTRLQKTQLLNIPGNQCIQLEPTYTDLGVPNRTDVYCAYKPSGQNGTVCVGDGGAAAYQTCRGRPTVVAYSVASFCNPDKPALLQNLCDPEYLRFINQFVYRIRRGYSDPCKNCTEPTNQCPLNQPADLS